MTDKELQFKLSRIAQGDMSAFEDVYSELKTPVMTVITRMTRDRELSEELFQDVFVKLYDSRSSLQNVSKPRAYIFRMASNMAIDAIRARKPTVDIEDCGELPAPPVSDPNEKLDVERALERLPSEQRQVVVLRINCGLKFREIAEATNTPSGTVLWRWQRALATLKKILGRYEN